MRASLRMHVPRYNRRHRLHPWLQHKRRGEWQPRPQPRRWRSLAHSPGAHVSLLRLSSRIVSSTGRRDGIQHGRLSPRRQQPGAVCALHLLHSATLEPPRASSARRRPSARSQGGEAHKGGRRRAGDERRRATLPPPLASRTLLLLRRLRQPAVVRLLRSSACCRPPPDVTPRRPQASPPKPNPRFSRKDLKRIKQEGPSIDDLHVGGRLAEGCQ